MPRGYRCVVFAVVGWLALCGEKPLQHITPNRATAGQKNPTPDPSPPATAEPYRPYPRVEDPKCYRDKNHDSADLCAQWRAAIAAEKAAQDAFVGNIVAGIGAALSVISTILVIIALGQTRKANRIAHSSAKPHAIVSLDNFVHWPGREGRNAEEWVSFDIVVTNVGGTGCVVKSVSRVWGATESQPTLMGGMDYTKAVPTGETVAVDPISISKRGIVGQPILRGVVVIDGPFIEDGGKWIRFAFRVLPTVSSPHNVHYAAYDDPEWMSIDQRRRERDRRRWYQFWKPKFRGTL